MHHPTAWACPLIRFQIARRSHRSHTQEQDHSTLSVQYLAANDVIDLSSSCYAVYNDLAHPPATQISNKYAWRTADGSYNNIDIPDLGKVWKPDGNVPTLPQMILIDILTGWNSLFPISPANSSFAFWPTSRPRTCIRYVSSRQAFKLITNNLKLITRLLRREGVRFLDQDSICGSRLFIVC